MNTTTGVDDTPFRGYEPALGRFMQVDPLAHRSSDLTPYHYANNNPIVFNDPSGLVVPAQASTWTDSQMRGYYYSHEWGGTSMGFSDWMDDGGPQGAGGQDVASFLDSHVRYKIFGTTGFGADGSSTAFGGYVVTQEGSWTSPAEGDSGFEDITSGDDYTPSSNNNGPGLSGSSGQAIDPRDRKFLTNGKSSPNPLRDPLGAIGWLIGRAIETGVGTVRYMAGRDNGAGLFGVQAIEMSAIKMGPYIVRQIEGYYVRSSTGILNGTFVKNVQTLAGVEDATSLFKLVQAFEQEAIESGASQIIINGIDIVEMKLINPGIASRLGYSFEQTGKNSIQLAKTLK